MAELEANNQNPDPIAHLHKMSMTAGAASSEYVAINSMAIASVILGAASGLVFVANSWVLLVIPIAAVLMAAVALRQIATSNGTQTGRIAAVIGIVLAVAIAGARGYAELSEQRANAPDVKAVQDHLDKFGQLVKDGRTGEAYRMMDSEFRKTMTSEQFEEQWRGILNSQEALMGKFQAIKSTGIVKFQTQGQTRFGVTGAILRFEKGDVGRRFTAVLREEGVGNMKRWTIWDLRELFMPTGGPPQ